MINLLTDSSNNPALIIIIVIVVLIIIGLVILYFLDKKWRAKKQLKSDIEFKDQLRRYAKKQFATKGARIEFGKFIKNKRWKYHYRKVYLGSVNFYENKSTTALDQKFYTIEKVSSKLSRKLFTDNFLIEEITQEAFDAEVALIEKRRRITKDEKQAEKARDHSIVQHAKANADKIKALNEIEIKNYEAKKARKFKPVKKKDPNK